MSQLYQYLTFQVTNRVAVITLNRSGQENRLDDHMISELQDAIHAAQISSQAKVILLRAAGPVFCLGYTVSYLKRIPQYSLEQHQAQSSLFAQLLIKLYRSPKVVICQIQGNATAEGAALASVCDLTVVAEDAQIGFPEVRYGQVPALVMPVLLRKLGETKSKELLLTGALISGRKAVAMGLLTHSAPHDQLNNVIQSLTDSLCKGNSFVALQLTKKMIVDIQDFPLENAMTFATKMNAHACSSEDFRRGIKAFENGTSLEW